MSKQLTLAETELIVKMLREKASINAIRKCTGYGVNILKKNSIRT